MRPMQVQETKGFLLSSRYASESPNTPTQSHPHWWRNSPTNKYTKTCLFWKSKDAQKNLPEVFRVQKIHWRGGWSFRFIGYTLFLMDSWRKWDFGEYAIYNTTHIVYAHREFESMCKDLHGFYRPRTSALVSWLVIIKLFTHLCEGGKLHDHAIVQVIVMYNCTIHTSQFLWEDGLARQQIQLLFREVISSEDLLYRPGTKYAFRIPWANSTFPHPLG